MNEKSLSESAPVLLVEDDPTDARLIEVAIERAGDFDVTTATDGDTGADLIVSRRWTFVIVDLVLPGKDGVDLPRWPRRTFYIQSLSLPHLLVKPAG